jgi:prefoldin subunit 5
VTFSLCPVQEEGRVAVVALEARLALMQSQLQALMSNGAGNVQHLQDQVQELQRQNQLLQQNLQELTMTVGEFRQKNAQLQNQLRESRLAYTTQTKSGNTLDFQKIL